MRGSLEPFRIVAPEGSILNAPRPSAVSVRHVTGQMLPDVVLGALHKCMGGVVPAEGSSSLWNVQIAARPVDPLSGLPRSEILMFNSGGTGARPTLDGLNATAFPSGVSTMSVEATEQIGPITVWRKELRCGSGGAGKYRGGLGQVIEIAPNAGYEFFFNAMFDRIKHAPRGREGGGPGAAGSVALDDGTKLAGKGRQHVPHDRRLVLNLPGGGGYGDPAERSQQLVEADIRGEYINR